MKIDHYKVQAFEYAFDETVDKGCFSIEYDCIGENGKRVSATKLDLKKAKRSVFTEYGFPTVGQWRAEKEIIVFPEGNNEENALVAKVVLIFEKKFGA